MSRYTVFIKELAQQDLKALSKSEPKAYKKALKLIAELYDHPQTGTGKPEQLKGFGGTSWSRRISQKHRLIYDIFEDVVQVIVLSTYGHYGDK